MTSKELLQIIKKDYNWETADCECDAYFEDYYKQLAEDLEILEIFKRYLKHHESWYESQAQWSREEFTFELQANNDWLPLKELKQYVSDFKKLKEWYFKNKEVNK